MPAIMRKMNVITRCGGQYRTARLKNDELGSQHHSIVLAVCNHPGLSQDQLARHLCLNKSTVARALNYLEEKGYVTRTPSESDRRVLLVEPTEKMQAAYPEVRQFTRDWNEQLAEGINADELALFFDILERMERRAKELTGNTDGGRNE